VWVLSVCVGIRVSGVCMYVGCVLGEWVSGICFGSAYVVCWCVSACVVYVCEGMCMCVRGVCWSIYVCWVYVLVCVEGVCVGGLYMCVGSLLK
jgi:hypothetical protein